MDGPEDEESSGVWLSGLLGVAAMLAKETGLTVLGINVLFDLYTHMRR